ncbi:hypothetical protein QBK99_07860 [Corticibacterium sp. UT-5YL-CI-8]|nr:hypothetical protein [Tianweitania sp. UT-5YL-CI-8]
MARPLGSFKVTDLERAIKGARNVGLPILRTEIGKDGRIILIHSETPAMPADQETIEI